MQLHNWLFLYSWYSEYFTWPHPDAAFMKMSAYYGSLDILVTADEQATSTAYLVQWSWVAHAWRPWYINSIVPHTLARVRSAYRPHDTKYIRIGRETRQIVTTTERTDWADWFDLWAERPIAHAGESPVMSKILLLMSRIQCPVMTLPSLWFQERGRFVSSLEERKGMAYCCKLFIWVIRSAEFCVHSSHIHSFLLLITIASIGMLSLIQTMRPGYWCTWLSSSNSAWTSLKQDWLNFYSSLHPTINSTRFPTTSEIENTTVFEVGGIDRQDGGQGETNVAYFYLLMAGGLVVPAIGFISLYCKLKRRERSSVQSTKDQRFKLSRSIIPYIGALAAALLINSLIIGVQHAYGNMLMTFAVLGPLAMTQREGIYLTVVFGTSMCFGNLNGK